MTQFTTRAYNSFTFDYNNSTIKKSSKEERLAQEAEYYKNIPAHLSIYFPRLLSSGFAKESEQYFLELELYPYENLGRLLIGQKLSLEQWEEIVQHIGDILQDFSKTVKQVSMVEDMEAMYIKKTEREYLRLVEGFETFRKLTAHKTFILNGVEYENFETVWPKVKEAFSHKLFNEALQPTVVHGDFCFSNILVGFLPDGKSILRFVDPRGKFGNLTVYGDPYYDLAKLMHSTDIGYEYFIFDHFEIGKDGENIFKLKYLDEEKVKVHELFRKHLYSKFDEVRIKLIQGTIFVGMCPFHYDSEKRQLAMYLSGVKLLNELLNQL